MYIMLHTWRLMLKSGLNEIVVNFFSKPYATCERYKHNVSTKRRDHSQDLSPIEEYLQVMKRIIDKNKLAPEKIEKLKEIKCRYELCQEHASASCDLSACRLSRLRTVYSRSVKKIDVEEEKKYEFDEINQYENNPDTMQIDERIQQIRNKVNAHIEDFEDNYRNRTSLHDLYEEVEYFSLINSLEMKRRAEFKKTITKVVSYSALWNFKSSATSETICSPDVSIKKDANNVHLTDETITNKMNALTCKAKTKVRKKETAKTWLCVCQ